MRRQLTVLFFIPVLILALQACAPKPQEDCGYAQNNQGQRLSWRGAVPINMMIHESVPAEFYPAIQSAMQKWETAAGQKIFRIVGTSYRESNAPQNDGVNVIYWMKKWDGRPADEQARTIVSYTDNRLTDSDIAINAANFSFYANQPKNAGDIHFESLVLHELGHALGLKHRDGEGSVMATVLAAQTTRASLSSADMSSVKCEY